MTNLLVVEALPAWTTNRLKRLVLSPKRHVVDAALAASILRLDVNAILRSGDLLGRLLDTFVVSQLRAELVVSDSRPRVYHLRQEQAGSRSTSSLTWAAVRLSASRLRPMRHLPAATRDTSWDSETDWAAHSWPASSSTRAPGRSCWPSE